MGKPTGFMEYKREVSKDVKPKERIKNFNEFHELLPMEKQQLQGARCMECGVPFCQAGMNICGMTSGCPLHNMVPEWNDLVYTGNWQQAYNRLKKTNSFPEFTYVFIISAMNCLFIELSVLRLFCGFFKISISN